jgi:hypothetical protein
VALQAGRKRWEVLSDSRVTFDAMSAHRHPRLRRQRRAHGKGRRLRPCRAGRRRTSPASAARTPESWACHCTKRRCCSRAPAVLVGSGILYRASGKQEHAAGHPGQLVAAGDARRHRRERRRAGTARGTHAGTRAGRQRLPRQGGARCCPACSRPSSTWAWSAPPSCTWRTSGSGQPMASRR